MVVMLIHNGLRQPLRPMSSPHSPSTVLPIKAGGLHWRVVAFTVLPKIVHRFLASYAARQRFIWLAPLPRTLTWDNGGRDSVRYSRPQVLLCHHSPQPHLNRIATWAPSCIAHRRPPWCRGSCRLSHDRRCETPRSLIGVFRGVIHSYRMRIGSM